MEATTPNLNTIPSELLFKISSYLFPNALNPMTVPMVLSASPTGVTSPLCALLWSGMHAAKTFYHSGTSLDVKEFRRAIAMLGVDKQIRHNLGGRICESMTLDASSQSHYVYFNIYRTTLTEKFRNGGLRNIRKIIIAPTLDTELLVDTLSILPELESVTVVRCNSSLDSEDNGSIWAGIHLKCLRKIQQAHPQLTEVQIRPHRVGKWNTDVYLSRTGRGRRGMKTLDIDAELEAWTEADVWAACGQLMQEKEESVEVTPPIVPTTPSAKFWGALAGRVEWSSRLETTSQRS